MSLGAIIAAILSGFLIGGAARFVVPGPDPMPFWLTVLIGLVGSAIGGAIGIALYGTHDLVNSHSHIFVTVMLEILAAAALVALYRRFVQQRPLTGPEAYRFPTRGFGIARLRARLRQLGVDPDKLQPPVAGRRAGLGPPADYVANELEQLQEQRERGEITEEEYKEARDRLRRF